MYDYFMPRTLTVIQGGGSGSVLTHGKSRDNHTGSRSGSTPRAGPVRYDNIPLYTTLTHTTRCLGQENNVLKPNKAQFALMEFIS